jgi:hypothetical protein
MYDHRRRQVINPCPATPGTVPRSDGVEPRVALSFDETEALL